MSAPVIVAVARDPAEAQIWVDALRDDGIEAGTYERGPGAAFGGGTMLVSDFPVLVAADRLGDARNVIAELGGAELLSPVAGGEHGPGWKWLLLPVAMVAALFAFVFVMNAATS